MASKPWEHAKSSGSEEDPLAARFVESLSFDTRLYDVDIRGSEAHAAMLRDAGLIGDADHDAITSGLAQIRRQIESSPGGVASWPGWRIELEDVHMCIEAALIDLIGEPGRMLHTGRSRNDQVALDLRLWIRDACADLAGHIDGVLEALEDLAGRQGDAVMPSYTHLQRAQPICVGGELMAWHAMLDKDRVALQRVSDDSLGAAQSPIGSGAIAGSGLGLDREHERDLLGLAGLSPNSIEATASRDEALDMMYILARTAMHLSRWAEQWIIYCSTEFGFVTIGDAYTTGSSMMPQKRNPDMLELIRGRCGGVYGDLVALLTICKGITIGYNRDLQEDKRHLFGAFDSVSECVLMARGIIRSANFNEEHIGAGLDRGYLDATSLAEYLVTKGVPFRTAHQVVGSLVRLCDSSGRQPLSQLTVQDVAGAVERAGADASRVGEDVHEWLGAANVVKRYRSAGNAGVGYREHLAAARSRR